ncbi:MAG: shikimate dehydrogenase [Armatimonadetes bacterium]|nr:shikimate dehydrogenase [Armatimonadota bacterium]
MKKFAFVVHPIAARDAARKYPLLGILPDGAIEAIMRIKKPSVVSQITGIESTTGAKTEGWFIGLPMTPHMMMEPSNLDFTYDQIVRCAEIAEGLGADIIGLGAFSSVVGDGGITVASRSKIAVTTGNAYTVATAIEGAIKACNLLGVNPADSELAVVGATGSIGKTCAKVLAPQFRSTVLLGRDLERTAAVADELPRARASTNPTDLKGAEVLITVSSAGKEIVFPENLAIGAVVVDVARPRDVSVRVSKERPDVLVIEGGVVKVPGKPEFNFNFGFPAGTAYACMSETMMLALDDRIENFTLGKEVSVQQVEEISSIAARHGFELSSFRSFERAVDEATIAKVREARQKVAVTA